jgi:hypothetical protein
MDEEVAWLADGHATSDAVTSNAPKYLFILISDAFDEPAHTKCVKCEMKEIS